MLSKLREANRDRQEEWDPERRTDPLYFATELAGEVGEACNIIKKLERERMGIAGSRASAAELADELADVIIVVDLIAERYDIDLELATARKFNKTSNKLGFSTKFTIVEE